MSATGIPVNKSNWVALRTKYELDPNIELLSDYTVSHDGYTTYLQPIYKGGRDIALNKQSLFSLPKSLTLFDFMKDLGRSGVYTAAHGHLSVIIDNIKYYVGVTSCSYPYLKLITQKSDDTFFSIRPTDDGYFQFVYKDDLYVTVEDKEPFMLYLSNKLEDIESDRQRFLLSELGNNSYSFFIKIRDRFNLTSNPIQRAWSYRNVGKYKNFIRANGMTYGSGFSLANDIAFTGEGLQLYINRSGLTKDHTWVSYYSEVVDKDYNRTVKIKADNSPTNIAIHHLTDSPYNTKVNLNTQELLVNIANTKSVMTEGYEYKVNSLQVASNPLYEQIPIDPCCDQTIPYTPKAFHGLPSDVVCGTYNFITNTTFTSGSLTTTTNWQSFTLGEHNFYGQLRNGCIRRIVWCPKRRTASLDQYLTKYNYIWRVAKFTDTTKRVLSEYDSEAREIASKRPYTFTPQDLHGLPERGLYPSPRIYNVTVDADLDLNKFLTDLYTNNPADLYTNDAHSIITTVYPYYYRISNGTARIGSQFAGYKIDWCIYTENNRTTINCGV